jgi:hypothetical protein
MDTPPPGSTIAEFIGRVIGACLIGVVILASSATILMASWNNSVPYLFGGSDITIGQSVAMLGIAWTVSAMTRFRL